MTKAKHPASKLRLLDQGVLELTADTNGEIDGPDYEPFLTINDMRAVMSLRQEIPGVWSGRQHALASEEEEPDFFALEGQWSVLSLREQYWFEGNGFNEERIEDERPNRVNLATLDVVLTRPPEKPGGALRYDAVSFKPKSLLEIDKVSRRHLREQRYCVARGWRWFVLKRPSKRNHENHKRLRSWALAAPYSIDEGAKDAKALAELLYRTTSKKPLGPLLAMVGRRLGISPADQYFVFSAAYYLGYLAIDHDFDLELEKLLNLKASPRWNKGR